MTKQTGQSGPPQSSNSPQLSSSPQSMPPKRSTLRATRIDVAHSESAVVPNAALPDRAVLLAVSGHSQQLVDHQFVDDQLVGRNHSDDNLRQQLERHARELGTQLQDQQRILDQRQSEFNAKLARIENELRSARIQQREREIELSEREIEFQTRWVVLHDKAIDVATAELSLQAEHAEDRLNTCYNQDKIKDALERWKVRLQELDKCELQLQAQLVDVASEQQRLQDQRQELETKHRQAMQQTAADRQAMQQHYEQHRLKVQEKEQQVERRKGSLEHFHADIARMYREALEMRICTEELWGRLSEQISPAQLVSNVAELRLKLTDQFRLAQQTLADQSTELQKLVCRLDSQQSSLGQHRERLQQWLARRQTEIERQAAQLVVRERELDQQQQNFESLENHWCQQRQQYEQTIRDLRRQIVRAGGSPM